MTEPRATLTLLGGKMAGGSCVVAPRGGQRPLAQPCLFSVLRQLPLRCTQRMFASQTEGELKVTQVLKESFPRATTIKVTDISGKGFSSSHRV